MPPPELSQEIFRKFGLCQLQKLLNTSGVCSAIQCMSSASCGISLCQKISVPLSRRTRQHSRSHAPHHSM